SHTTSASLRRSSFILSSDQESIIGAHGPFLESINVSEWEEERSESTKTPLRVKVFPNACIDTVLPLGTTGHVIAISDTHQGQLGEDYKVYAAVVHAAHLAIGGYAFPRLRFVITTQSSTELPCQPTVNIVPQSNKLLVLTENSLKVFDVIFDPSEEHTVFELPEVENFELRTELGAEFGNAVIRPLFVSPF
ncbi:hypothetical protein PFISCL1PPCAC_20884, partial [Pristionchus fissidentatus]